MSFWKTLLGVGAVAGVTFAALKVLEKLDEQKDEHWTAMEGDLEGGLSYPDMAERPVNYAGGPIVYPPYEEDVTAEEAEEAQPLDLEAEREDLED